MLKKSIRVAKWLRYVARTVLVLVAGFWFVFALLSGAEGFGGGLKGILINSFNALPWLLLFVFVWIVWKFELLGGILITLFGIITIFFFKTYQDVIVFLMVSLPLILLGGCFIGSWVLRKRMKHDL